MKQFTKTKENFTCSNCGTEVMGTGYTNHCPNCLWSKHVDKNPGDRAETCGGMMRPTPAEKKGSEYMLLHTCEKCGFIRKNKLEKNDNFQAFLDIHRS